MKPKAEAMKDLLNVRKHRYSIELIGYAGEASKTVLADKEPIRQSEFVAAGQIDIRPAVMFLLRTVDYGGQKKLIYGGDTYTIYRVYDRPDDGKTELYCEVRLGGN